VGLVRSTSRFIVLVALTFVAHVTWARPDVPWDGLYFGANLGDASSSSCDNWALHGGTIGPVAASEFSNRDCSKSSAPVGGVQFGENFQFKSLVWGVGADLDLWSAKTLSRSLKYSGDVPPAGAYALPSRQNPGGFGAIGPRIGYAGDTWMPFVRVGALITAGAHNSALSYTPTGAMKSIATFDGRQNYAAVGWLAGGGFELGLNGAWSITAEYLRASLGRGSNSTSSCSGPAAACAAFSGISFDNSHERFSANMVRVGITYWFGYW
jgi:opacity protein-like surface antigen